jgi:hypothetical protein
MRATLEIEIPEGVPTPVLIRALERFGCRVNEFRLDRWSQPISDQSPPASPPTREMSTLVKLNVSLRDIINHSTLLEDEIISIGYDINTHLLAPEILTKISKKYLRDSDQFYKFTNLIKAFDTNHPVYDFFDAIDRREIITSLLDDSNVRGVEKMLEILSRQEVECDSFRREMVWQIMEYTISDSSHIVKWHPIVMCLTDVISPQMAHEYQRAVQEAGLEKKCHLLLPKKKQDVLVLETTLGAGLTRDHITSLRESSNLDKSWMFLSATSTSPVSTSSTVS